MVAQVERDHGRVVVTSDGRPAVVILGVDGLESLEETLFVLGDPVLLAAIRSGEVDLAAGRVERPTSEQLLARYWGG